MTDKLREEIARVYCESAWGSGEFDRLSKEGIAREGWLKHADAMLPFIDRARAEAIEAAAKVAVDAVNQCREEGETDLRAVRSGVDAAIRALK